MGSAIGSLQIHEFTGRVSGFPAGATLAKVEWRRLHRQKVMERMSSKVFVGNLDFNTTRAEVQTLFAEVGEIRDVFLPTDRESGRPRGFAFVEYANEEDAAKAIE